MIYFELEKYVCEKIINEIFENQKKYYKNIKAKKAVRILLFTLMI